LCASEWKVVIYLSLQGASNVDAVGKYIDFTVAFCIKHNNLWQPNPMICKTMLDTAKREYEKVQEMRRLVLLLTRTEWGTRRQKRGIFSLVGHVAYPLLRMLDSDSEVFYNQKIAQLEEERQLDWLKLIHEQTIVRSTFKSVNLTLHDVSTNELTLTRELNNILNVINVGNEKIENSYALTALLLMLNDHAMGIWQAIEEKYVYNTVIQVCLHWRNGIVQPQVLPPSCVTQILKISQDSFPRDVEELY
jgi:hypothetical protein